jgi:hypothetical protein
LHWPSAKAWSFALGGQCIVHYSLNTLRALPLFKAAVNVETLREACEGVAAVVAAAGPSLNRNLEEWAAVSRGVDRAVLISIDASLRTCLGAGVEPHFAISPPRANPRHLLGLPANSRTRLVADPGADPRVMSAFAGRTLVFRERGNDAPWAWLDASSEQAGCLDARGGALGLAIELASLFGCDPIVLIGADLAYTKGQPCCRGIVYEEEWASAVRDGATYEEIWASWIGPHACNVSDAHGVPTRTAAPMLACRDWLAGVSMKARPRRICNATGAGILGDDAVEAIVLTEVFDAGPVVDIEARLSPRVAPPWQAEGVVSLETVLLKAPAQVEQYLEEFMAGAPGDRVQALLSESIHEAAPPRADMPNTPSAGRAGGRAQVVRVPDGAHLTDDLHGALLATVNEEAWRHWSSNEIACFVTSAAQPYIQSRSPLGRDIFPGLARMFEATLSADRHPALAVPLYDTLQFLRWTFTRDPEELVDFQPHVVVPMVRHVHEWAARTGLVARRKPGKPPYRVAYLSLNSSLAPNNAVPRVIFSLLTGHAELASSRFHFFYYACAGLHQEFREELQAIGVTTRATLGYANPAAAVAQLRVALAEDRIDMLLTDAPGGLATMLFETRSAPVQAMCDLGFSAWGGSQLDYQFLCFTTEPEAFNLNRDRCERVDFRFHERFMSEPFAAADLEAQRQRFRPWRHVFGFVGRLVKLSPEYLQAVRRILARVPDAVFYMGGVGDATIVREAIASFGDQASQVVFDHASVDNRVMSQVIDTFLDTFPFIGGLSCMEAQAAGRPVVFLSDPRPGVSRFQAVMRDRVLRAGSLDDYVTIASRLATDADEWTARAREATRGATRGSDCVTTAAQLEETFDRLIQKAGANAQ